MRGGGGAGGPEKKKATIMMEQLLVGASAEEGKKRVREQEMEQNVTHEAKRLKVRTGESNRKVWLMKLPASVADVWSQIPGSGVPLGRITIENGKAALKLSGPEVADIPKDYTVDFQTESDPIRVFSLDAGSESGPSFEGIVEQRCSLRPVRSLEYKKLCYDRHRKSIMPKKTVISIEHNEGGKGNALHFVTTKGAKVKPEAGSDADTDDDYGESNMTKDELRQVMFKHFETKQFWTAKDLVRATMQPNTLVQEVLKEICIYHRRGDHRAHHELKAQFR